MEFPMPGKRTLRGPFISCQQELFPEVAQQYGSLSRRYKTLLHVLDTVGIEDLLPSPPLRLRGRPLASRASLARSFLAKVGLHIPMTSGLHEHLLYEQVPRSLCGWPARSKIPVKPLFRAPSRRLRRQNWDSDPCGVDQERLPGASAGA